MNTQAIRQLEAERDVDTAGHRPIRVLHLRDSPWVDGPGRTILETGSHVDPSRVDYHIGVLVAKREGEHPLVDAARQRGITITALDDHGQLGAELIEPILRVIDECQIDILHTSEFRSALIAQIIKRRRPHLKMVATAHGWIANTLRRRITRLLDKIMFRRFDHVIIVSQATRSLVPRWWLPDSRATVLRNALVLKSYGSETIDKPRRAVDPNGEIVLVNVGRLSPEKGQEMLLNALHALTPRWPKLRLKFAGIGPLEEQLRSVAKTLGLEDRVEFVGYVKDMPHLYADIDLVVQSSFTEGLPNVILEAAYLRVPIVATAVGGTAEVISHRESGWLIQPTLEQLTDGITQFLERPQDFVRMAQRAHQGILENYSFDVRTEKLTQVYERLLGRRP
ncbi:glycosyltransferase family 4 protein [Steroidobacter sp.]|uniref:glycosyltransferase family 4 protein n=1 Tax=Steroidobacter sp. TaxID=1978227 RepID=UPI001A463F10|nr:glycosyltransferase family 4 protein [Steroidobacter sp.]MBL8266078.1 glycosyltransferase family 4 protein [Steroidobacter sp.]